MSVQVYDWLAHHARGTPERPAASDLFSDRHYGYAALNERANRAARLLRDGLGVGRGDRVAVLAHNSTDLVELAYACQKLGSIFLPLNWRLAVPELEFICADATPSVLLYGPEFAAQAREVARLTGLRQLLDMADGEPCGYERGLAAAAAEPPPPPGLSQDDTWIVMYTSGTTGRPKGARITHGMMFYNAVHCAMVAKVSPDSKGVTFLPLFHIGGQNVYLNPLLHFGGTSLVLRSFDARVLLRLLSDPAEGVTHAFGVPTNLLMMSQLPAFAAADFGHLVSLGIGGAAASKALLEVYGAKGIGLQQGWGMTETATLGTMLPSAMAAAKIGSSGLKVMHAELKIVDPAGAEVPTGAVGELLIRGPTVTPGYWNRPEANRAAFVDGWFRTGDAATVDADGYYTIVDRWKDMYISGGENVYPAEVENVLYQLAEVAECAVVGIPHPKWGEVGRAFLALKPGAGLGEAEVVGHCLRRLAKFKVPAEVRFVEELPHNATGKVTKHELPRD